ncbi:U2-type spliceosomal complex subunit CWC25 NDAI_0F03960 [Naumovozyma dairenensis CBS 421]|uniref:Pre-mRNA-splicing factor CWC25 n=1 Tax=Naumovozyma dairenensis (strain ATCC 10597 / BCRC 20456 / CBS 421 / NBRC 0211 / NRRL Y-12639) TaxID=1071378 RepID=G0WD53_NAUDC|nr:hypothetical protein NDAI_0F03960 [Naumovozyma dairenensis CBS 421]CCD25714.1 hypothetical protein NDAI_0F03960 [Naumovozyma dairenensis CBS 421]
MGSGDLNLLKSWNPKLMKNRKKVWETEQEILKEEQKLLERKKEIEKERQFNELLNAERDIDGVDSSSSSSTIKNKASTGLEWMYENNVPDEKEDYLLGKKKLDTSVIKRQESNTEENKMLKKTGERTSTKKKFDLSSEDPMAKMKQAYLLKKKSTLKRGSTTTNTRPSGGITKPGRNMVQSRSKPNVNASKKKLIRMTV